MIAPSYDRHIPVMRDPTIASLRVEGGKTYVDGTFGAGGHSVAMLAAGAGRVVGIDRDPYVIDGAAAIVAKSDGRLILVQGRYSEMEDILSGQGITAVAGVLLDIGTSSMQMDDAERGFAAMKDGPLDMRMGQSGMSAADFVNEADEEEIADILYHYGEEPRSRRVARAIVAARPITRTMELAAVIRRALGARITDKKDPAIRAFQAIRIHVNRELDELNEGLDAAERVLAPGGQLAVISFHSLEDRIVKRFLRERSGAVPSGSRHRPAQDGQNPAPTFEAVEKAVRPDSAELAENPRARSATLRSARRTAAAPWISVVRSTRQ